MKIRQALKLYNKSKKTILKKRSIDDEGFIIGGPNIRFNQRYILKGMRYTSYKKTKDGRTVKRYRWYTSIKNGKAFYRIQKYLRQNEQFRFFDDWKDGFDFDVIIKRELPSTLKALPTLGKMHYVYDDGKINPSREDVIKINSIIPYELASEHLLKYFDEDSKKHYWLFGEYTDYFVIGQNTEGKEIYFARTLDGGWFSFGENWCDGGTGRLDTDGTLYKVAHSND